MEVQSLLNYIILNNMSRGSYFKKLNIIGIHMKKVSKAFIFLLITLSNIIANGEDTWMTKMLQQQKKNMGRISKYIFLYVLLENYINCFMYLFHYFHIGWIWWYQNLENYLKKEQLHHSLFFNYFV